MTFIPFSVVVLAKPGNEVMDHLAYGTRWKDMLLDSANTLFWPFIISLTVRLPPMALRDPPHH